MFIYSTQGSFAAKDRTMLISACLVNKSRDKLRLLKDICRKKFTTIRVIKKMLDCIKNTFFSVLIYSCMWSMSFVFKQIRKKKSLELQAVTCCLTWESLRIGGTGGHPYFAPRSWKIADSLISDSTDSQMQLSNGKNYRSVVCKWNHLRGSCKVPSIIVVCSFRHKGHYTPL